MAKNARLQTAQDVATAALMVALIEVCKLFMQGLPNIEMTSFLIILFTLRFGRLCLYAILAFILIEGLIYGFGPWWAMYLYIWPLLAFVAHAFRRVDSALFWAVVSGAFGLLFGLLCAIPYFFIGLAGGSLSQGLTQMFSWWTAGIAYDLIHGAGNFVLMLALYRPMSRLLERIPQIIRR
ncbi:MAG: hypothetical protein IJ418_12795 [Clostridia bacterium]|nr:hypothetical protein [Clostridia bacterium]